MPHRSSESTPLCRVREVRSFERPVTLRMPFRFGALTLTEAPQSFIQVTLETTNGTTTRGIAAEMLLPKWFDKDPVLTNEQNVAQLRTALFTATRRYQKDSEFRTAFGLHAQHYRAHMDECAGLGLNALVANFGTALLDRAILDALFRHLDISALEGVQRNVSGIDDSLTPDLSGFDLPAFLGSLNPSLTIRPRHTVGMVDAIRESDKPRDGAVEDGLPESLEAVARFYGNRYYKLKVGGDVAADVDRLLRIAEVLDERAEPYFATLDGNEQYQDVEGVLALWEAISRETRLRRLKESILFVEQPIKRAAALSTSIRPLAEQIPVEIDESDADLEAFLTARSLGYQGVSSKSCKGFYRSLLNVARCAQWNREEQRERYFLSAEDLVVQAGIALQQDLILARLVGCTHIERNGHHYVNGMAQAPPSEQAAFLAAHPDLYHQQDGVTRLRIENGTLSFSSLAVAGLGCATTPEWSAMTEHAYTESWQGQALWETQ